MKGEYWRLKEEKYKLIIMKGEEKVIKIKDERRVGSI